MGCLNKHTLLLHRSRQYAYGKCLKVQTNGLVDGCQRFVSDTPKQSLCQACGCHFGFHADYQTSLSVGIINDSDTVPTDLATSLTPRSVSSSPSPSSVTEHPKAPTTSANVSNDTKAAASTLAMITAATCSEFPEWPNGDITMEIAQHTLSGFRHTGWATSCMKSWTTKSTSCMKVKCLGVFTCSTEGCSFLKRPSPTRKKLQQQLTSSKCPTHASILNYIKCSCTLTWKQHLHTNKQTLVHSGTHIHPWPPVIHIPPAAHSRLTRQILNAPSTTPKALLVGSAFNESVRDIHESNNNLDRIGYRRRKILKSHNHASNLDNMIQWQVRLC